MTRGENATVKLQRGRAQLSAEGKDRASEQFAHFVLQRGRAQLSAEGLTPSSPAASWPVASTGPRSIERGRSAIRCFHDRRTRASTGPRSIERGRKGPEAAKADIRLLQRGRAQLSAEGMSIWRGPRGAHRRFNGAALN